MLERQRKARGDREAILLRDGLSGLHDVGGLDRLFGRGSPAAVQEALAEGWRHFKVKVGGAPEDDDRRGGPRPRRPSDPTAS